MCMLVRGPVRGACAIQGTEGQPRLIPCPSLSARASYGQTIDICLVPPSSGPSPACCHWASAPYPCPVLLQRQKYPQLARQSALHTAGSRLVPLLFYAPGPGTLVEELMPHLVPRAWGVEWEQGAFTLSSHGFCHRPHCGNPFSVHQRNTAEVSRPYLSPPGPWAVRDMGPAMGTVLDVTA